MTVVSIGLDEAAIRDALETLSRIENGFVRAYARALNKTAAGTRSDMVKLAREDYKYKAAAVRARTSVYKATWSDLQSSVKSTGGGGLLSDFAGTRQTKTGLSVNIKKSTGLQRIRHAFLNKARSTGKVISMWRKRMDDGRLSARYPVEALYGPHPELIYNTPENWEKLSSQASDRLSAVFASEVDGVLRQFG